MEKTISDYLEKRIKLHLKKNVAEAKRALQKANRAYKKEVKKYNNFENIKKHKNRIIYSAHVYYSSQVRPLDITWHDKNLCVAFCEMLRCLSEQIKEKKIKKGMSTFSVCAEFNKATFPIPQSYWPTYDHNNWLMVVFKES